ncbi:MAG: class I SAM-dependent methyltransferase [Mycoplasmatales bacterium]
MYNNTCQLCNGDTLMICISDVNFFQCPTCMLVKRDLNDRLTANEEINRYNQHVNKIDDVSYQNYFKKYIEEGLVPYINNKYSCLDFGSGPKPVLKYVLERDYNLKVSIYDKYYSVDSSVLNKKYDIITCTEVVEHIDDIIGLFKQFSLLLNDDGILFIMTNFHNIKIKDNYGIKEFSDWFYIRDKTHVSFFNNNTFKKISNVFNFKEIYTNNKNIIVLQKGDKIWKKYVL